MVKNNGFKIASIYIGTVIGAGFASGQEVVQFFAGYGLKGVYGIMLAGVLFGIIGAFVLLMVHKYKVISYHDWLTPNFGKPMTLLVEVILTMLLLSWYCVMLAGSGALFEQQFGYSKEIGIAVMSIVTFITFLFSMKGLAIINEILVPILVVGIIVLGSLVIFSSDVVFSNSGGASFLVNRGNWITSALLYVSYNSIGAIIVMSSLSPLVTSKRVAVTGGALGGFGLGFMALFLLIPILILYTEVSTVEIPMMSVAAKFGGNMSIIYGILLWFAMLTTAIANGFVVIQSVERKVRLNHFTTCLLFCLGAIPLARLGFKNLVSTLYPLFGYIGIIIFVVLLWKKKKKI